MQFTGFNRTSLMKVCLLGALAFASLSAQAGSQSFQHRFHSKKDSSERFGVNLEPLWLAVGGIGGKAEYFITDKVSVGLSGNYIPDHKVETSGSSNDIGSYHSEHSEIVLGSNVMLTGTLQKDGFYLNPGVGYQKTSISHYSSLDLGGSLNSAFLRLTAGYQWITSSDFRFALGAGTSVLQESDVVIVDNRGSEVYREKASGSGLALDIHVGYIF